MITLAIIEVYNNYTELGINSRTATDGEELKMVNEFVDYKKNVFKEKPEKQLAIFLETKVNNTYPDVVFTEYNPFAYENWNTSRNSIDIFDMKILHYIYTKRNVTSQGIIKDLSINYKELLLSLEKLMDSRLIERKHEQWILTNKDIFGVEKVEAVEAKISNWDKVMQQALINKNFASESSVLSKKKNDPKPEIMDRMNDFGIGIYIYNKNGFSKISQAKKNRFPTNYNSIYFNECIGRILNHS